MTFRRAGCCHQSLSVSCGMRIMWLSLPSNRPPRALLSCPTSPPHPRVPPPRSLRGARPPLPSPSGLRGAGTVSTTDSGAPEPRRGGHRAAQRAPPQKKSLPPRRASPPLTPPSRPAARPRGAGEGSPGGSASPSACCGVWLPALTSRLLWRGAAATEDAFLPGWSPWDPAN